MILMNEQFVTKDAAWR